MKDIEVVPRIRIGGVPYTLEQLPKEQVQEIIRKRVDLGLSGMNYERKAAC